MFMVSCSTEEDLEVIPNEDVLTIMVLSPKQAHSIGTCPILWTPGPSCAC
jgi:hypothetical protein